MFVIIAYDIQEDKRRTRLHKKLKDFGPRVQYSVFEAEINKNEFVKLKKLLTEFELGEEDTIRLYTVCSECWHKVQIFGCGKLTKDQDVYIA